MRIIDLKAEDKETIRRVAAVLLEGFREHWPGAWPDMQSAMEEVEEAVWAEGRINRVAIDENGAVLGWIGGMPEYDGCVFELHPLVVSPAHQGQGIGRALVEDFEARVLERGAYTITLGSDDVDGMTTLSGVDLYPDVWGHVARIRNLKGHPYEFYRKLGYKITGVVPDANGPGKPDILMSKRVR